MGEGDRGEDEISDSRGEIRGFLRKWFRRIV